MKTNSFVTHFLLTITTAVFAFCSMESFAQDEKDVSKTNINNKASLKTFRLSLNMGKNERREFHRLQQIAKTKSFKGTNSCGRTWSEQVVYDADQTNRTQFILTNPSGKDAYGRTYEEYREYITGFSLDGFLGYKFDDKVDKDSVEQVLKRNFHGFDRVYLNCNKKYDGVAEIWISRSIKDIPSWGDLQNEMWNVIALLSSAYGVSFSAPRIGPSTMNRDGSIPMISKFDNGKTTIIVQSAYIRDKKLGSLMIRAIAPYVNPDLVELDTDCEDGRAWAVEKMPVLQDFDMLKSPFANRMDEVQKYVSAVLARKPKHLTK